jgi:hypothetical protein
MWRLLMGVYDTVEVPCPKCGKIAGFQSKSGECAMRDYTLGNCPVNVMFDVNRHSPHVCECGAKFMVEYKLVVDSAEAVLYKEDADDEG